MRIMGNKLQYRASYNIEQNFKERLIGAETFSVSAPIN